MPIEARYPLRQHPRPYSALSTDHYSHTMGWAFKLLDTLNLVTRQGVSARGIWNTRITQRLYFRRLALGGYAVNFGFRAALDHLLNMNLTREEAEWLVEQVPFKGGPHEAEIRQMILDSVDQYLFNGDVWAIPEGELVFPNLPLMVVSGNPFEVAIAEAALLNAFNTGISLATKSRRICNEARDRKTGELFPVVDFALRRMTCGLLGTPEITEALIAGGMVSTSNDMAAFLSRGDVWGSESRSIGAKGTVAHLWILIFGSDEDGGEAYAFAYPHAAAFLPDTFDFLKLGVPAAIEEIKRLRAAGYNQIILMRDDSGDLAPRAVAAGEMIDAAGLERVLNFASSDLNEYTIRAIFDQTSRIRGFGVGTKAVTELKSPGCVYKTIALTMLDGRVVPVIKVSGDVIKTTIPGRLRVYRLYDEHGMAVADALANPFVDFPYSGSVELFNPGGSHFGVNYHRSQMLLRHYVRSGRLVGKLPPPREVQRIGWERFRHLSASYKDLNNPDVYPVGMTREVHELRERLIAEKWV